MNETDVVSTLNRLYHLLVRSFAAYSVEVRSVSYRGPEEMLDVLKQIAEEQRILAARIGSAIRERHEMPVAGHYPMEFAAWNDVALPRVLERAAELLERMAKEANVIAQREPEAPVFHFAKEVAHLAQRHLGKVRDALTMKAAGI